MRKEMSEVLDIIRDYGVGRFMSEMILMTLLMGVLAGALLIFGAAVGDPNVTL
jgi:hypothetical protein